MRNTRHQLGFLTPRSIAVLVILLAALLLPLWWLSDQPAPSPALVAKEQGASQSTANASPPLPAAAINHPDAFGLTWGLQADAELPPDAVRMGCHGQPRDSMSQTHADSCNPYKGDSSCRIVLPVLCFQQTGLAEGMPAGSLASTQPVSGFVLGSLAPMRAAKKSWARAGVWPSIMMAAAGV